MVYLMWGIFNIPLIFSIIISLVSFLIDAYGDIRYAIIQRNRAKKMRKKIKTHL